MWRALIAGVVFQHASVALLLRELSRNPALLDLCGFHPVPRKARRRHLLADTTHEVPVAAMVTKASASEVRTLDGLLSRTFDETPELAECCTDLCADRGYDSGSLNGRLMDTWGIRPVIDTRKMWREEKAQGGRDRKATVTQPLDPEKADTIVFTERGEVRCVCPAMGTERPLSFHGFEADRGCLKYRSLSGRGRLHRPGGM